MRYERPKTRSEWVYALLKEKILSGQYQPLERLVADQIGRELGTSVIPIREALQRLESDGLVEIQPYVGARVAAIAERDLEELFEIRKRLEPLLARSAVAGVTPAALSQLERICAEMDQAIEADDMFAYSRKNWEFHESIYRLSPWKTRHSSLQQRQIDAYLLTPPTTFQAVSQGTACPVGERTAGVGVRAATPCGGHSGAASISDLGCAQPHIRLSMPDTTCK